MKRLSDKERILLEVEEEKNAPHVKEMYIIVEWRKNRTWGYNPHATATVHFENGNSEKNHFSCSGCGYDKLSTVIGMVFNSYLKYLLWEKKLDNPPYGISSYVNNGVKRYYYAEGVGIDCYYKIALYLNRKFELLCESENVKVYRLY